MKTDIYRNRHAFYNLKYHLVVITKYRYPTINEKIQIRLEEISERLFLKWNCKIISINTGNNYIHIFFIAPPQVQLSKLVNNYKTVSSRLLRKEFADFLKVFYSNPYFWNKSYLILSSGQTDLKSISEYIGGK